MSKLSMVFVAACALALFAAPAAHADGLDTYTGVLTGSGNQLLENFTLGLDFRASTNLWVNELGVWDDFGNGLSSPHEASLWDLSDTSAPLASIHFDAGLTGDLRGGYRYLPLPSPIHIDAGTEFSVAVYYPDGNADTNGNAHGAARMLVPGPIFNGGAAANIWETGFGPRYIQGDAFPSTLDPWFHGGPANRYHSGSFSQTPNPEPGTLVLLGGVLIGFGAWRRRQRVRGESV